MLNNTLGAMLTMLRAEAKLSTNSNVGQSSNPALKVLLKRHYVTLYDQHDWPHLTNKWEDVAISAGSRYYDFPANISMEHANTLYMRDGAQWVPVDYGFDPTQYNIFDSDEDQRSDPILAWRLYGTTQFELWPLPATAGSVRIVGKQSMGAFTADADQCVIDDHLVVLFCAAELLGEKGGEAKKGFAEARLSQLRANLDKTPSFRPGSHADKPRRPSGVRIIAVR